jgi:hypothetical protein
VSWRATGHGGAAVLVTAASFRGRPVFFSVGDAQTPPPASREPRNLAAEIVNFVVILAAFGAAIFFAHRNVSLGRADSKGALRMAVVTFGVSVVGTFLAMHVVPSLVLELSLLSRAIGLAFFWSSQSWLFYLALEPFVRKTWPHVLVSWTRLLGGRPNDPLVGRDVLIGCAVGSALSLAPLVVTLWRPDPRPITMTMRLQGEARGLFSALLVAGPWSLSVTFAMLFALLLVTRLLRLPGLAFVPAIGFQAFYFAQDGAGPFVIAGAVQAAFFLLVLRRIGVVAAAATHGAWLLLTMAPLTLDTSAWYAGRSFAVLGAIALIASWGFRRAAAGRPLLLARLEE